MHYKVVFNNGEKLVSSGVFGKETEVVYSTDHWATAPVGYLFVFDNEQDARDLYPSLLNQCGTELWECYVRGVQDSSHAWIADFHTATSIEGLKRFWEGESLDGILPFPIPKGSVLVEKVKLVRKVHCEIL
jgi:hypothetical protein